MLQSEAEALAAKREAHKPRSLSLKRWAAAHDSVKGWHVALVDNHAAIVAGARRNVENSIRRGSLDAAIKAAGYLLIARVRQQLDASVDTRPEGGDGTAPFTSGSAPKADAQIPNGYNAQSPLPAPPDNQ